MTEQEWKLTREILTLKRQLVANDMERLRLAAHIVESEIVAHGEEYRPEEPAKE